MQQMMQQMGSLTNILISTPGLVEDDGKFALASFLRFGASNHCTTNEKHLDSRTNSPMKTLNFPKVQPINNDPGAIPTS